MPRPARSALTAPAVVPGVLLTRSAKRGEQCTVPTPLDPANDPDRYEARKEDQPPPGGPAAGRPSTLPELLGKDASFQDTPSPYVWVLGLIGVASFLLLVAFVFSRLSP